MEAPTPIVRKGNGTAHTRPKEEMPQDGTTGGPQELRLS